MSDLKRAGNAAGDGTGQPPASADPAAGSSASPLSEPMGCSLARRARDLRRGVVQVAVVNSTLPALVLVGSAQRYPMWLISTLLGLVTAQLVASAVVYRRLRRPGRSVSAQQLRRTGRLTLTMFVLLGLSMNAALLGWPLASLLGGR